MLAELQSENHVPGIDVSGINGIGLESGNPDMTAGRSAPWLQDVVAEDVWTSWEVNYRDVIILDPSGRVFAAYNLTNHDLAFSSYYSELKGLMIDAANAPP